MKILKQFHQVSFILNVLLLMELCFDLNLNLVVKSNLLLFSSIFLKEITIKIIKLIKIKILFITS